MLQLSQRALTASDADGELFVDRNEELGAVERALALGFSVYVAGPAGSGKTSVLRRLDSRLGERAVFINVARVESFSSLMAHLAHEIRTKDPARDPDHEALDGPHVGDTLVALRAVAFEHLGDTTPIVLLDGLEATLRHELFGRQRDELWEIPLRWVISGRSALARPADTFFEAVVTLDHLDPASMRELLLRRAATGTKDERHRLEQLANTLPLLLDPATPRQLLATARTVMLSAEPDLALDQLQRRRNARVHLSPTADRVLDALSSLGPTHAGDERLLEEIGTTRSRVVQVLRELEDAGLVRSVRDGRRKLYGADIGDDFVVEDPDSGEIVVVGPRRKRNAR